MPSVIDKLITKTMTSDLMYIKTYDQICEVKDFRFRTIEVADLLFVTHAY